MIDATVDDSEEALPDGVVLGESVTTSVAFTGCDGASVAFKGSSGSTVAFWAML